jgi:hypothetical protein
MAAAEHEVALGKIIVEHAAGGAWRHSRHHCLLVDSDVIEAAEVNENSIITNAPDSPRVAS